MVGMHASVAPCVCGTVNLTAKTVTRWIFRRMKMENEKLLSHLSTIERMLGKIEGVAFVLEDKYATPLFDAVDAIDCELEEIRDGK
jgi:hypothetical protein